MTKAAGTDLTMADLRTIEARVRRKTEPGANGCVLWTGASTPTGYGTYMYKRRDGSRSFVLRAHRIMYMLANGLIPEGLVLDHLCRVRGCVNPEHLEAVTPAENNRRAAGYPRMQAGTGTPSRGSIEQLPSGRFRVVYYQDGQRHRTQPFQTRDEAQRHKDVLVGRVAQGIRYDLAKHRVPLARYAEQWFGMRITGPNHGQARAKERWALDRHILPAFGNWEISSITRLDIQAWLGTLALAPSSVRSAYQILGQILRTAAADGYLPAGTPLGKGLVQLPALATEPSWHVLTQPELDHLLAVCLQDWPAQYPVVRLLADTGMRQQEAFALRRRDIADGWVDVLTGLKRVSGAYVEGTRTKSGRRRRVVIEPVTQEALQAQLDAHDWPLVFPGRGGQARDVGAWRARQWIPLASAAGFPEVHPNDLRHTHASLLLAAGVSAQVVAERLGHSSTRMVMTTYGHALPGGQAEALRLLRQR